MGISVDMEFDFPRELLKRMLRQMVELHKKKAAESDELIQDDLSHRLYLKMKLNQPVTEQKALWFQCKLPHPIHEQTEVCLLVKDEARKDLKRRVNEGEFEEKVPQLRKILSLSKLSKYEGAKAKRALAQSYDVFFIDKHVSHLALRWTGREFIKQKRRPIPVKIDLTDPATSLETALGRTYSVMKLADVQSIAFGLPSMTPKQLLENLEAVVTTTLSFLDHYGLKPVCFEVQSHPLPDACFWYHPSILGGEVAKTEDIVPDAELVALAAKADEAEKAKEAKKIRAKKRPLLDEDAPKKRRKAKH